MVTTEEWADDFFESDLELTAFLAAQIPTQSPPPQPTHATEQLTLPAFD